MCLYGTYLQAEGFIDETSIDALAVCIGNVHGKYPPSGPNLRFDLLKVRQIQLHLHVERIMKISFRDICIVLLPALFFKFMLPAFN